LELPRGRVKFRRYADEQRLSLTVKYFWYWQPKNNFPPPTVTRPSEFGGGERLNIACTQTNLPAREERAIVDSWCDALPNLDIKLLWFSSRVPQQLFDAACRVAGLEGLYVKWSGIDDLSSIGRASTLRYFHLGQSAKLSSIEALGNCGHLKWLGLELLSRVRELHPVGTLTHLEGLSLEGSMGTTWRVNTLAPLGSLSVLRFLSIANLRSEDGSLAGLFPLHSLATFRHANWWSAAEVAEIKRLNPGLASA
jgi:hypothetical protein